MAAPALARVRVLQRLRDVADRRDSAGKRPGHRLRGSHAEVLLQPRVNGDSACVERVVGIDRDELHVHEGRLAGLVELCLRHHGIVPVKHALAG